MCMNTSPNVNKRLKLLRFIGIEIFFQQVCYMVSGKVTIRKFKMLYFRNERYHMHGARHLKKYLFLRLIQPYIDKNSEDLATLILEFDDVA